MSGVEIRVRSNSRQARSDLNQLERSVGNIEKTANSVSKAFRNLAVGIGVAFSTATVSKGINRATDSLTSMQNRVALVTGRTKELNSVLDDLYNISRRTGQPVDLAADTFNRFGLALSEAGKSSADILKAVESVNKSIAISGGGVESARAALTQLGQGLASGTLRGEELNSVLEQAPRLAQAIADAMGKPRGELRKLAEAGQLTTEVVFDALLSQSEKLSEEFSTLEFTSAEALVTLRDQVGRVVAEISKQLNITTSFTNRIMKLSAAIEANRSAIVDNVVSFARGFRDSFEGVIAVGRGVARILQAIFNRAIDALPNLTSPFRDFAQVINAELVTGLLYAGAIVKRFGLDLEGLFRRITDTKFSGAIRQVFQSKSLKEFGDALFRIGEVLDRYGKRWYNFGNITEKVLRSTNVFLLETGIAFGIVDQQLIRLRYTSFERFGKAAGVVADAFKDISRNIAASNFIVAVQVGLLKANQIITNFGKAIDALSNNKISKLFIVTRNTFLQIFNNSSKYLGLTRNFIEKTLIAIERKFAWVYDKVIGNSWWTDTMKETLSLANEYLPKTLNVLKTFAEKASDKFKSIKSVIQEGFSSRSRFEVIIDKIKFNFKAISSFVKNLAEPIASSISNAVRVGLSNLRDVSPQIASYLSVGLAAALTKFISPAFFGKTFAKLGPLFGISIFVAVSTALNDAVLKSGFYESVARGLGNAIGNGIQTIVANVPQILKALLRVGAAFGQGLADTIGNSIIGLPAKVLSFLGPAGGLLTTILYGGLTAAIFFSGVRKQLFSLVTSLLSTAASSGVIGRSGLLYNLFVGSNSSHLEKRITEHGLNVSNKVAGKLASKNRRRGLMQLTQLSGYVIGAELLLGDLIGTTGAAIAGIGASVLQTLAIGNPETVRAVVSTFNSVLAKIFARVNAAEVFTKGKNILSSLFQASTSNIVSDISGISFATKNSTSLFAKGWAFASNKASLAIEAFSKLSLNRLRRIKTATISTNVALSTINAASAGASAAGAIGAAASAAGAKSSKLSGFFSTITAGAIGFGDVITSKILPAISRLLGALKIKGAVVAFGSSIGTAFAGVTTAIGSILAGIPLMAIAAGTAAASILGLGVGGVIYSAFFGEGDTFLERVKNNFDNVLGFFGLLNKSVADVRKESLKTLRNIEKLSGKEFDIDLSAKLKDIDLSQSTDRELLKIERAVNNLDKNRKKADSEVATFGQVSEETRQAIKQSVRDVEVAIREGGEGGVGSASDAALQRLRDTLLSVSEREDSTVLGRLFNRDTEGANALKEFIESEQFRDNNLSNPSVARAFASGIQMRLPEGIELPEEFKSLLNQVANLGKLPTEVADAFQAVAPGADAELLAKVISGVGGLELPSAQLKALETAVSDAFKRITAEGFLGRRQRTVTAIQEATGQELTQGQIATLNVQNLKEFEFLVKEINKNKKFLALDTADKKTIDDIIASSQALPEDSPIRNAVKDLESLQAQLSAKAFRGLRFEIDEDTLADLNRQLSGANAPTIKPTFDPQFTGAALEGETDNYTLLKDVEDTLDQINSKQIQRAKELVKLNKLNSRDFSTIDAIDSEVASLNTKLAYQVGLVNNRGSAEENWLNLLQTAANTIQDRSISFNDLLKLDKSTIRDIVDVQEKIQRLNLAIEMMGKLPLGDPMDGRFLEDLEKQLTAALALRKKLFGGIGKGTGETVFEKFVGKFNAAGFNADLTQVASMSRKMITSLIKPLNLIEKAQKRIIKLGLKDSAGRKAQLKIIKDQRQLIADQILDTGTVEQAAIAFEAIGLDPALVDESRKAQELAFNIVNLEDKLVNTSAKNLTLRKSINLELDLSRQLLEEITTKAEAATDRMRSAFASSFKELLKGEATVQQFFDKFLDSLSNQIIDTVVDSFTQAFFKAAGLDRMFDNMFAGLGLFGAQVGTGQEDPTQANQDNISVNADKIAEQANTVAEGFNQGFKDGIDNSWMDTLFSGAGGYISAFGEGIMGMLNGILGGLNGAGGSSFSNMFSMLGSFGSGIGNFASGFASSVGNMFSSFGGLFMNDGGIVPHTPYSRAGIDSVPAMLTPGELVVPTNKVQAFENKNSNQQSVVNLSITGDVSRQTRQEIVKMLPQISAGVNATNKENNFKYRR